MPKIIRYSVPEFVQLPLAGRPFLSEQGNTVTRGLVVKFEHDEHYWDLHLRDVDYLNKKDRRWERRRKKDAYGGTIVIPQTYCTHHSARKKRGIDEYLSISCYDVSIYIGPGNRNPWSEIVWPDVLGTDLFNGGVLGKQFLADNSK